MQTASSRPSRMLRLRQNRGFAEARLLRRQPALLQLLQLLGRQLAQAGVENGAQLRPVGPGTEAQQLRQTDVGNDRQAW